MSVDLSQLEQAESDLEEWLVEQTASGVPEPVLVNHPRDYADDVDDRYVPRMWGNSKQ